MSVRHPITGALSNPEWDSVRDRWNERYCAQVMADARPEPEPRRYPVNLIRVSAVLLVGVAVFAVLWSL